MTEELDPRIHGIQEALLRILAGEEGAMAPLSPRHDELDAVAHGINILVQELNEEARQQRALREEIDRVLLNMTDGLLVANLDGALVRVNDALSQLVGRGPEELVGSPMAILCQDDTVVPGLQKKLAATGRVDAYECTMRHRDGTPLPVLVNASVLPGPGGPSRLVCVVHDLRDVRTRIQAEADARVERRRADEIAAAHMNLEEALLELRTTQAQLIQAQKMEALGQLAGGLAHDFNNLLVVMLSGAEQIRALAPGNPELVEEAEQITDAALRAQQLTSQLLTFARRRPHAPAVVEVNAVVQRSTRMLTRLLRDGVDWSTQLADEAWRAQVDPGQLEQIIVNLSVNARDAMPDGGHLTVRTVNRTLAEGDPDRPPDLEAGQYVAVEVEDTGEGIPEHVRARMFDPFFTTKEPGKGTGLGLAICYGIVRGAGGSIAVRTELGKGSCFTVLLPRATVVEDRAPEEAPRAQEEIVLLAEDEPGIRRVLRRALQREGFHVIEAEDGRKALEVLASHEGAVDLLLTDVRMPGMGGPELAKKVRDRDPKVRVLYISGHTDDALPPMEPGGREAFLPKPFLPGEVVAKIRSLMGQAS